MPKILQTGSGIAKMRTANGSISFGDTI